MSTRLREARRAPGSEWLKDHPKLLEIGYVISRRLIAWAYPLLKRFNPRLTERTLVRSEEIVKGYLFNCQMCGQCTLHRTGMTCPMTCPKNLRNGPCGGVRRDGSCEVIPEMPCVWVQAWERSRHMLIYTDDIKVVQPPLNRALQGSSSWINLIEGADAQTPRGWDAIVERLEG
ncbi:MAG TPA: methylenetetrahydrofolate reductase C-terminal domain-containing protein [Roseiflexaceae bacterium]